jgi:DNA-binding LytR/AlgR family response regulator
MRERLARLSFRLGPPIGVGLVLGLSGPFGTYHALPTAPRLVYWLAVISVTWLLADAVLRRFDEIASERMPVPRLTVPFVGACLAAVPATGVVTMANGLSGIGWPEDIVVLYGRVLLLLAAIALPVYAWEEMQERIAAMADPEPPRSASSLGRQEDTNARPSGGNDLALFKARLSTPLDGRLLCLEMQDHYLKVHHSAGSEMILCRMEDATRELGGLGRRVHRSWWVAADAVEAVERDGQRLLLRLADDRRVPVGRSYRPDLRAAGWI